MPTLTQKAAARIRKLGIGDRLTLRNGQATPAKLRAVYRAADAAGIRVSVKTFSDCAIVERRA